MSSAHTPGPWEYNDPAKYTQGHGRFSETAVYAPGNAFPWRMAEITGPHESIAVANARLIAAAPDLLTALRGMLDVQSRRRHPLGMPDEGIAIDAAEAASKARVAIAKAGGVP